MSHRRQRRRRSALGVGAPPSSRGRLLLLVGSFMLPLLAWSAVSYVPWLWHPQVLVEDPGDTTVAGAHAYIARGQRVDLEVFIARNAQLDAAGALCASGSRVNPIYLPAPHEVARALVTAFTTAPQRAGDRWLHQSLWHSCMVIFWGFCCSALLGLPLGIAAGAHAAWAGLVEPFVDFVRYMPAPVFGGLAVAILGLGMEPKIAIVFIGTFFQMVLVVANTTRRVERSLLEVAQTLGAGGWQLLRYVVVPAALPGLYRDMRILVGWAWTYLVVAELVGEKSGVSAFIAEQQRYQHYDNVYAAIIIIGVVGLGVDQVLARAGAVLFAREPAVPLRARLRRIVTGPTAAGTPR